MILQKSRRYVKRGGSPTISEGTIKPRTTPSLTVGLLPRTTELLILQKNFRVARLKKHQSHFIQLMICL